jgi:hypothetical protein
MRVCRAAPAAFWTSIKGDHAEWWSDGEKDRPGAEHPRRAGEFAAGGFELRPPALVPHKTCARVGFGVSGPEFRIAARPCSRAH